MINKISAFSLIELLFSFMIIGLISLIAIPVYQDYAIRVRVSEGLELATAAKSAIGETFNSQNGVLNQAATGYISPPPTDNVNQITIANDGSGTITISYTANAGNGTLILTPTLAANSPIIWDCKGGDLASKYRPGICR